MHIDFLLEMETTGRSGMILECGVAKGGSAIVMAAAKRRKRCLHLYVEVLELAWGVPLPLGTGLFECIVATDVFYSHEAVAPLARTLSALAGANTEVLLAAGRNRQAADTFFAHAAAEGWAIALVDRKSLDPLFQSPEIDVWRLRRAG